jgi:hypothetical protein
MTKIKFECWWTSTESINQRMLDQFIFEEDLEKYEIVNSNPDYTIVFGRTNWDDLETPKEKTFYFSQEPLWSPNQPKDHIHNYCSKIFISDRRDYPNREEYIETFIPMLYAGRGENDTRPEWDWSKKIKNKSFNKNKNLSIIVTKNGTQHSNQISNPETSTINYTLRTDLGIELSKNKNIDVYGTFWDNNGDNIKGEIWNKHIGLDEYKFSIACENSIQKNYVSEKFWDVVLTETIPIYLGCNNIDEFIPENCYISLNNKSMEEMVKSINDVLTNPNYYYNMYIKNILQLKQDFFQKHEYNLWEKIKKEIGYV